MADAIVGRGLIRIHPSGGGPVAALRGLDLTVGEGEVAAVVGPSGSGKSTLLRLVAGLDRAVGRAPRGPRARPDRRLGDGAGRAIDASGSASSSSTTGEPSSPYLTAADAIDLPLALRGVPEAERRAARRRAARPGRAGGPRAAPTATSCPAGSSSASPSPWPWPRGRRSSWPTSRPASSMARPPRRSWPSCATSSGPRARPA